MPGVYWGPMTHPTRLSLRARTVPLALLCLVAAGCPADGERRDGDATPPDAEFLVAAGDSTFWVRATAEGVRRRGSSLLLARHDGVFYELYTADDDRSFYDAVFVGQRIYRRDLVSGDSVLVYRDSLVPALQRRWAREHPDDQELAPDEEGSERPAGQATADLVLVDVHDRFLSIEHHQDVDLSGAPHIHNTVRRVVDLDAGETATVADVAGSSAPEIVRRGQALLASAQDSIRAARGPRADQARDAAADLAFDERSFSVTDVEGDPAIAFVVPGRGLRSAGAALPLPPIPVPEPAWWDMVRPTLPVASDSMSEEWSGRHYRVRARYDADGERASVAVAGADGREWPVGRMPAPLRRVLWLDAPQLDSTSRAALERAFDEAVFYDDAARVASRSRRASPATGRRGAAGAARVVPVRQRRPALPAARRPAAPSTRSVSR